MRLSGYGVLALCTYAAGPERCSGPVLPMAPCVEGDAGTPDAGVDAGTADGGVDAGPIDSGIADSGAPAAIAYVQSKAGGMAISSLTYPSPVTAGHLLIVGVAFTAMTNTAPPTDTLGNVWTDSGAGCVPSFTGSCGEVWFTLASTTSGDDTVTLPNEAYSGSVYEFDWGSSGGTLDGVTSNLLAMTTAGADNMTTTTAMLGGDDLLIGFFNTLHGPMVHGTRYLSPTGDVNQLMEYAMGTGGPPVDTSANATDMYGAGDPYCGLLLGFKRN